MPEENKKKDQAEEVNYCSGHLVDGDYAAEDYCCEGGVRCDSCGMHEASSPGGGSFAAGFEVPALREKIARLCAVVRRLAPATCYWEDMKRQFPDSDYVRCTTMWPDDDSEWCVGCLAEAAISGRTKISGLREKVDDSRHEVNATQLAKSMSEAVDALYRSSDDVILAVVVVTAASGSFLASDSRLLDSPQQTVLRDEFAEQLKKYLRLLGTVCHPQNLA
jgi:hypothetical protein